MTTKKPKMHIFLLIASALAICTYVVQYLYWPFINILEGYFFSNFDLWSVINPLMYIVAHSLPMLVLLVYALVRGKSLKTDALIPVAYLLLAVHWLADLWEMFTYSFQGWHYDGLEVLRYIAPSLTVFLACVLVAALWICGARGRVWTTPAVLSLAFPCVYMVYVQFDLLSDAAVLPALLRLGYVLVEVVVLVLTAASLIAAGMGRQESAE